MFFFLRTIWIIYCSRLRSEVILNVRIPRSHRWKSNSKNSTTLIILLSSDLHLCVLNTFSSLSPDFYPVTPPASSPPSTPRCFGRSELQILSSSTFPLHVSPGASRFGSSPPVPPHALTPALLPPSSFCTPP